MVRGGGGCGGNGGGRGGGGKVMTQFTLGLRESFLRSRLPFYCEVLSRPALRIPCGRTVTCTTLTLHTPFRN